MDFENTRPTHEGFEPRVKFEQIFDAQDPSERKTKIVCTLG